MSEAFRAYGSRSALPSATGRWKLSIRPGGWIVAERETPGGGQERRRIAIAEARGALGASLGGLLWQGEVLETREGAGGDAGSETDLTAQFPGKVRKILVQAGQEVKAGEPLCLVEAMKMEFAIKAPFAGKVMKILVAEAQQLSPGDRLVDLEKHG